MMRFDECAHRYAQHAHVQERLAEWLAEWLPELGLLGRGVEYGAGEGMFTRFALKHFRELHAVDLAPRMAAAGQERTPGAHWSQGDAWQGLELNSEVDAIISASLLQWCPDLTQVFSRWREKVRTGSRMLHGFYVSPTLPELSGLQGANSAPLLWRTTEEWTSALIESGWSVDRFEYQTHRVVYENALELLRSLHRIGAVRQVAIHGAELRGVIREYDRQFTADAGGVFASWTFCRVLATA